MSSFSDSDAFEGASLSARAMAARGTPYLDELNPPQREAVERLDGPVLMLAGAGTGKTKALMARVAHLKMTGRARANEILAVTFTNKAAREMKKRLADTPYSMKEPIPWMGTFHAICVKLLRRHAELIGDFPAVKKAQVSSTSIQSSDDDTILDDGDDGPYDQGPVPRPMPRTAPTLHLRSNFTILDTDDQLRLLKQLVQAAEIDDKRWPARMLAGIIDQWKNRAWTPENLPAAESAAYDGKGPELYRQYQKRLLELNAVDFGDLLLHVVTIFQKHDDILQQYQRWFRYILVDEYQDTNVAQYLLLRLLAAGHKNICCVGDDDQSIYGWRGAEVGNILRFEKDFPGAHVVRLEQNYRSTPHILAAASGVIAGNKGRLGKELWTDTKDGEKVHLIGHWDGEEEARWIGEEIEAMQGGTRGMRPIGLDKIAILVRASHQMRAFEDRFLTIGMPYRVIGGPRFYERMEIRDAMAYFRLVTSPSDDLAFERIVNTPKRGLAQVSVQTIQKIARDHEVPLLDAARLAIEQEALSKARRKSLSEFVDGIARWGRMADDAAITHMELAEIILDESGYTGMWQNDKSPEAPGRLENLKELVAALEQFENLQGFLEHVSLTMDNQSGDEGQKVTIMTLHAAKGLEFPVVFLPGWEEGFLPSQRTMDESGQKGLEEERRLAYVGITRAEELCIISFVANRLYFGRWQSQLPSRFIDELPEAHVKILTPPGLYGGGYGAAGMGAGAPSTLEARVAEADGYNSPGWKRLQARAAQRPISQPRGAKSSVIDIKAVSAHTVGERVFHQKFGYGLIVGIEGDKLEIDFEKAGSKKVVAQFVSGADDIPF